MYHYNIIKQVIETLLAHAPESIDDLSLRSGFSRDYFQKVFSEFVGISPKQFERYLSLQYAKELLKENKSHNKISLDLKLSSQSRVYDMFVDIEAMTPGEYKEGRITIEYTTENSRFGYFLVANTEKGICNILFADSENDAIKELQSRWPQAHIIEKENILQIPVIEYFKQDKISKIKCHLHGTNYQIKVWEALLSIPFGQIASYGDIAEALGDKNNARAVGAAIGQNPIGYIIPCHRVLKSSGDISGYRWGVIRKKIMLGFEGAKKYE